MKRIKSIAFLSIKEFIKGRSFYATLFIGVIVFMLTFVSAQLTYKTVAKTTIDIGQTIIYFFLIFTSLFISANSIKNEIENGTLPLVLSQGVSRLEFFIGKTLGKILIIVMIFTFLSTLVISLYYFFGGDFDINIIYSLSTLLISVMVISAMSLLFSFFLNEYLNYFLCFSIFFFTSLFEGISTSRFFIKGVMAKFLEYLNLALPNFYKLNLSNYVGEAPLDSLLYVKIVIYGLMYYLVICTLSFFVFKSRDIH